MPERTQESTSQQECPNCHKETLQREAAGVWTCDACGRSVAGGAFDADTGAAETLEKSIRESTEELEQAKERLED